jgi:hypothetical protein
LNFQLNLAKASNIVECETIRQSKEFHKKLAKINQHKKKIGENFKQIKFKRRKSSPITNSMFVSRMLMKNTKMEIIHSKSIPSNLEKMRVIMEYTYIHYVFLRLFLIRFNVYYYKHFVVNELSKVKEIVFEMCEKE